MKIEAQMSDLIAQEEGLSVADFLQSRIHKAFTLVADDLCSLGYLDTETRIAVSGAIGKVLDLFRQKMAEIGVDQIEMDRDLARELVLKAAKRAAKEAVYMRPPPPSGGYAPLSEEAIEGTGKIGNEDEDKDDEKEGAGSSYDPLRTIIEADGHHMFHLTPKQIAFNIWMKELTGQLPEQTKLQPVAQSTESEPYPDTVVERSMPDRFEIYDLDSVILEDQQADPGNWDSQFGWDQTMSETEQAEVPLIRPGYKI